MTGAALDYNGIGQRVRGEIEAKLLPKFDAAEKDIYDRDIISLVKFSKSTSSFSNHQLSKSKTLPTTLSRVAIARFIFGETNLRSTRVGRTWMSDFFQAEVQKFPDGPCITMPRGVQSNGDSSTDTFSATTAAAAAAANKSESVLKAEKYNATATRPRQYGRGRRA